jgi:single-strand DNA-binding protein
MDLNRVMLIGRVASDPESRTTPQGTNVCSFRIATNFSWKDQSGQKQDKAEFHQIVMWRRLAEIAAQYVKKGSKIYVDGRLQTRDWEGQDGIKRYRTEIIADNMIMLDRPPMTESGTYGSGNFTQPAPAAEPVKTEIPTMNASADEEEIKVEDIPF